MKKIKSKHNDLLNYFIHDRQDLSPAYVRSCEKFFRELGEKRNKFKASSSNATRHNLFTEIEKNKKKNKATSSQAPKRVGPPNNVEDFKLDISSGIL